jgi:peptidyl-prolyl cis-trans isomerase C
MNSRMGGTGRLFSILGCSALAFVIVGGLACRPKAPAPAEPKQAQPAATEPKAPAVAEPEEQKAPAAVEPNKAASAADPNKPAVTVDGQVISEKDVADRISVAMRQYARQLGNLPPQYAEQIQKQMRAQVVDRLVLERLLDEQVKAGHIEVTEQDAAAEMEKVAARQQPPMTLADFQARVESQGGNFQEIKDEFRRGIGYRKVLESQWGGKANVTDEEAKQYYDAHTKDYEQPEQIRASHILISTQAKDPNADPNKVKAEAKEKATKILEQVKAGGDFAALAKDNSDCPSAPKGGDLGFFHRGMMVKPFEDAAFALQKGQTSDLVETQFGYHIIKVTDHNDAHTIPFEETKAEIVTRLSDEKKNTLTKEYLESLRAKAKIDYAPGYEPPAAQPAPQPQAVQPAPQATAPAPQPAQPAPQATSPAQPAPQPAPSATPPTEPVKPPVQPAPTTGTTEPNAAKVAPR